MRRDREWSRAPRLAGLRRFAVAITLFNVLGHTVFGFEQSWLQPIVAVLTGYAVELLLETVGAVAGGRRPRYAGGFVPLVDFLLSAHISSLAISMLLYANDRLAVLAFAVAVAIASKAVFRVAGERGSRHVLNPSNFGITVTLLLFPWVGIAPPYHFTENLGPVGDWLLPGLIVVSGSFLNLRYTRRIPLLLAWVIGFGVQAVLRSLMYDTPLLSALAPMTGVAFVLYTFYMVTDPATTPSSVRGQIAFGAAVAATYGLLLAGHVVFGFFFALTAVCVVRGAYIALRQPVVQPGLRRTTPAVAKTAVVGEPVHPAVPAARVLGEG